MKHHIVVIAVLGATACGGKFGSNGVGVGGKKGMLSATAAADKCEEAAKGHDRPFVVQWDATDLADFEAKAARDTVVVRYQGCELQILHHCSDPVVAGKMGAYGTPQFTSGTKQGFEVANEGELYAKLPLGAAKLSARVSAGEALNLEYFVTGVARTSRESLYRDELAAYNGCEGATHFVAAYNLGAFTLSTVETRELEAGVEAGNVGGGGRGATRRASLGQGGDLESCDTQDQRGCRVPIRLTLQEISPGAAPTAAAPATRGATATPAAEGPTQAEALWKHGKELLSKGDGAGCVDQLDKALAADLRLMDRSDFKLDRATCAMAAGQCSGGTKQYREALAAADTKRQQEDWQLDLKARERSNRFCPSGTATNDADFLIRARREMVAAKKVADGKTCRALIKKAVEHHKGLRKAGQGTGNEFVFNSRALTDAGNIYDPAALCVAKATKKCSEGLKVLKLQCEATTGDYCAKAVEKSWPQTVKMMKLDCK